jgi:hypothetical protein
MKFHPIHACSQRLRRCLNKCLELSLHSFLLLILSFLNLPVFLCLLKWMRCLDFVCILPPWNALGKLPYNRSLASLFSHSPILPLAQSLKMAVSCIFTF